MSILYKRTSTTEFAEVDRKVIEMLYRPELRPGMTAQEARKVLGSLEKTIWP